MHFRLPSYKKLALIFVGIVAVYLLFAWLALPRILQSQAEKFIAEKSGHQLTMDRPEFNPFELRLRLSGLHLVQPDGTPLLALRELVVDMSAASIWRRAFVFDDIRIDGVEANVVLLPKGQLNWSALIDALKSKEPSTDTSLPRLDIQHFMLADSKLDFADKRDASAFATRIEPLNLELTDISTLPNDKGQYRVSAHTAFGAHIDWHGEISLEPLVMSGSLRVDEVDIAKLTSYFKEQLPIVPPAGIAGVSTDYRLGFNGGKAELNLEHLAAKVSGLRLQGKQETSPLLAIDAIEAKDGEFDLTKNNLALGQFSISGGSVDLKPGKGSAAKALQFGSLALGDIRVNLAAHQATLNHVALKDGQVRATRDAQGRIDLVEALQALAPPAQSKQVSTPESKKKANDTPAATNWRYRAEKFDLSGFGVAVRDEIIAPAAELALEDIAISLEGISEDMKVAVPLRAAFKVHSGGNFSAEGKVIPAGPSADVRLKLADLSLIPAQPYLSAAAKLKLAAGNLSTEGRASYNAKGAGYQGNFYLRDLRLNEAESGDLFLALKSLGSREFEVTPKKLDIGELVLDGLDTKLIIAKDKTVSLSRVLLPPKGDAAAKPAEASAATAPAKSPPTFLVNIDRLRVSHGEMDFADYSLALPFGTRIHDLQGNVSGLSSQPGASAQLELDGQVDDYGLARAVGQLDLFNPTDAMDLKVVFRNIEMTRLTPYSATFAGRKIDSGKLSLDLEYKIKQRQLQGENQVIMDQLTLGEKVDSPGAVNLPLDLAIAILQDSDGRIDLGLPVSGDLNDPKFSYGGIVWKALVNVFTKIVTAPFRALGALFGGGEKFENIAFETGVAQLTPPEREKLVKIAGALNKRPGLALSVHGAYAEPDRLALQDKQMRRNVAEKAGQHVEADSDPGPISMHQPKVQAALEKMFSDRFGGDELVALKDGFRKANPGQLEESASGKMLTKLSGMFRSKRTLSEQEISGLKGGDFYAILFERLRGSVVIDEPRLQALAMARGVAAAAALQAASAPMGRVAVLAVEKVETEGRDVPVKLVLGAAAKSASGVAAGGAAK